VGAQANICLINKADIVAACRESMQALLEAAKTQSGYAYSTILCISCCGRSMILGGEADAEGRVLAEMLPKGVVLTGAYCLGEICPTRHKDGLATNRFHNCSITFCML
ncbi:MAG: FIST C-terminal domain-containing protein, partial [Deltaproteobacteria bacterium]|nr:FIST C-terminal domain-containing protein [Deltaproteobacteria bacterium]